MLIEENKQTQRSVVAAFDFDVTITTHDTFAPFLVRAFGRWRTYKAFAQLGIDGLLVLCRLSSRDRFKERIIRKLFAGEPVLELSEVGRVYAETIRKLVRPSAQHRIAWHKAQGHRLVIVSASLDLYLEPMAKELGFDDLLCTRLASIDGKFTGGLDGENCRAQEKANKLEELFGNLSSIELYAYGDSRGDKEMLEVAEHSYFRPFEPNGLLSK